MYVMQCEEPTTARKNRAKVQIHTPCRTSKTEHAIRAEAPRKRQLWPPITKEIVTEGYFRSLLSYSYNLRFTIVRV